MTASASGRLAGGLLLVLGLSACEAGFEPPSKVDSLRVLAVRPEPGSGSPGETVTLEMLYADGASKPSAASPRPVQIAWLGGCHNPPSRQYFGCQPLLQAIAAELDEHVVTTALDGAPEGYFGVGTSFAMPIPDDILTSAPRIATDPVHFGVSYAFFGVCAGELRARPQKTDGVPLGCVDPASGAELGPDDFVTGFSTVYTYEGAVNANPRLTGVRVGPVAVSDTPCASDADCEGLSGGPSAASGFGCAPNGLCSPIVPRCRKSSDCPDTVIFPEIERSSAEALPGEDAHEIVWVNFYATDGDIGGSQLVNDRSTGWIENHGVDFNPPEHAGAVGIWVTVHDQRGGATWRAFQVLVR